jgi:hypothetical protein
VDAVVGIEQNALEPIAAYSKQALGTGPSVPGMDIPDQPGALGRTIGGPQFVAMLAVVGPKKEGAVYLGQESGVSVLFPAVDVLDQLRARPRAIAPP